MLQLKAVHTRKSTIARLLHLLKSQAQISIPKHFSPVWLLAEDQLPVFGVVLRIVLLIYI